MNRKNEKYKIEQEADFYFSEIKCQKWPDLRVTETIISLKFVFLFCFERRFLWTGAHAVRVRKRATPKVKEMQNILLWTKPIYSNQSIILFGLWRSPNKTKYKHTQNRGKKEKHSNKLIDTNTSHLCVGYSTPSLSIFVDFFCHRVYFSSKLIYIFRLLFVNMAVVSSSTSTMAAARRIGTFLSVAQFIVINLVIILICTGYRPTEARKQMPMLIDDDTHHSRMNRPGKSLFTRLLLHFSKNKNEEQKPENK